jgi:hypothetical protein
MTKSTQTAAPTPEVVVSDKNTIDKAFAGAGPVPAPEVETATANPVQATVKTYAAPIGEDDVISTFDKVIHRPFSESDLAERCIKMSDLDKEIAQVEVAKKEANDEFNANIKDLESQRLAISAAVGKRGGEKNVVLCKRVVEDRKVVQIFIRDSLEIIEERSLNAAELQTELKLAKSNVVPGRWPADRKVGEAEANAPEPDWDKMNEGKEPTAADGFEEDSQEIVGRQKGRKGGRKAAKD